MFEHAPSIRLRGVAVHNLREIDLDLPHHRLTVICGVSGSGKTTLAIDTLFAEGQRRFIESFSAYSRLFLARLPRPQAEEISGIPPAVLIRQPDSFSTSSRTLGAVTELYDYLRLAYARWAEPHCPHCHRPLTAWSADSAARLCEQLPQGTRFGIGFAEPLPDHEEWPQWARSLQEAGFVRAVVGAQTVDLTEPRAKAAELRDPGPRPKPESLDSLSDPPPRTQGVEESHSRSHAFVVVDRLVAGSISAQRIVESWETALEYGKGHACLWVQVDDKRPGMAPITIPHEMVELDGAHWAFMALRSSLHCSSCGVDVASASPALFNPNSPIGACPSCSAPAVTAGRPSSSRPRASHSDPLAECPQCHGSHLRSDALGYHLLGLNFDQLSRLPIHELLSRFRQWADDSRIDTPGSRRMIQQICSRLEYLDFIGLGYLALRRELMTLSRGEAQRVALTTALGSSLVQLLYVLDEPTAGLHPADIRRVQQAMTMLRDRGNTVVVVEHDDEVIRSADLVVEIGPEAGEAGGRVTFCGTPQELAEDSQSLTGRYLTRRRADTIPKRRPTGRGWIKLLRARGHNLQHVDAAFPLGVLAVVAGVSGSGKTALVDGTLYPALCRRKRKRSPTPLPYDEIVGDGQFDDVILVDQAPLSRSPRSNPVTYIKAFDEIRKLFAESMYARMRNLTPGHFSFNVDGGGRCPTCEGDGLLTIDMHFLPDVQVHCPDCHGKRYRPDILEICYRGKSIFDVLEMTVREAYAFFRGQPKIQGRLQFLHDVGLEYLRLGQPASTLSAGEAQRLKLASHLGATRRSRTVFLMDEPSRGLHFHDVVKLMDCFDALLAVGHSLIIVEHDLRLIQAADYVIELGPGAASRGGRIVVAGTPEDVARCDESPTAPFLRKVLANATDWQQDASSD